MHRLAQGLLVSLITATAASGCAFVHTSVEAESVRVLAAAEIETCRKLGKTRVTVLNTVVGIPRPPETIQIELATLARNTAAGMGGDSVVATSPVTEGEQTFAIYKCVDPNAAVE